MDDLEHTTYCFVFRNSNGALYIICVCTQSLGHVNQRIQPGVGGIAYISGDLLDVLLLPHIVKPPIRDHAGNIESWLS